MSDLKTDLNLGNIQVPSTWFHMHLQEVNLDLLVDLTHPPTRALHIFKFEAKSLLTTSK